MVTLRKKRSTSISKTLHIPPLQTTHDVFLQLERKKKILTVLREYKSWKEGLWESKLNGRFRKLLAESW